MNANEAKLVLQACRPNGEDSRLPFFAEALALAESDPELKTWWEAQQAFDQKISAKLKEVPVPSELRARLLTEGKVVQMPTSKLVPHWLAIAAIIVVLGVIGDLVVHPVSRTAPIARAEYSATALDFLGNDAPSLGMMSPEHDKVLAWLQERNAPTGSFPTTHMTALPTVGCQKFMVKGHAVSLICFALTGGGIVHLFVVDEKGLADPPSSTGPEFKQIASWATASWSDGDKSYMLATQAGPDALRQLL
jgi:hypothetical protein